MKLIARSSAKINLTLDILSRLENGYHTLDSLVQTVGIWDEIGLEIGAGDEISLRCNRSDLEDAQNLCARAVKLWKEATGQKFGARLSLEKRIPSGAGLGGGSGNAAATLVLLNRAFKDHFSDGELAVLGARLGADVPLFLRGGLLRMEGIGDHLTPLSARFEGWLVVVKPSVSLSTPAVYRAWDEGGFQSGKWTAGALEAEVLSDLARNLGNDLEKAALKIGFDASIYKNRLRDVGAVGALMTGSGSAVFGLFAREATAREAAAQLESLLEKDAALFVAPFCERGVEVMELPTSDF